MKKILISLFFYVLYLLPLAILGYYFQISTQIPFKGLKLAVYNTLFQSGIAAFLVTTAAFLVASSFARMSDQRRKTYEWMCLAPAFLPAIFSILLVLSLFKPFPFGHTGVIITFCLVYFGYAAVVIMNAYRNKLLRYHIVSEVYGIDSTFFYFKLALPLLKKDLLNIFVTVFVLCATSLSIPMALAGAKGHNIEFYIYELIYMNNQWAQALWVSLLQIVVIFVLIRGLAGNSLSYQITEQQVSSGYIKNKRSIFGFLLEIYLGIFILFLSQVLFKTFQYSDFLWLNKDQIIQAMLNSLVAAAGTFLFFSVILVMKVYGVLNSIKPPAYLSLIIPSTAIVGFSLYLIFPVYASLTLEVTKIALAIVILNSNYFFRNYFSSLLEQKKQLSLVGKVYGMSFSQICVWILMPLFKKSLSLVFVIILLINFLDFALLKALGTQHQFYANYIYSFVSSYRLDQGYALLGLLLVLASLVLVFSYIVRMAYVSYKKSKI